MKKINFWVILLLVAVMMLAVAQYQNHQVIEECIEDVSNKCINIFSYTVMLENENAALSNKVEECGCDIDRH